MRTLTDRQYAKTASDDDGIVVAGNQEEAKAPGGQTIAGPFLKFPPRICTESVPSQLSITRA